MKTLRIAISDLEFNKFGLNSDEISFSELLDVVSSELSKQRLKKSIELAEKFGLSKITMDEIKKEVTAVRKNEKNYFYPAFYADGLST